MRKTMLTYTVLVLATLGVLWAQNSQQEFDVKKQFEVEDTIFTDNFESGDIHNWQGGNGLKLSWEPEKLHFRIAKDDTKSTRLTLHIRKDSPATVLEVTPSLASLITAIIPSELPPLKAGDRVQVSLVAKAEKVADIDGTLHVRQASGPPRTLAKPLPILISGKGSTEETLPPPEPTGIFKFTDSDGDGVPDDAQRFIETQEHLSRPEKEVLLLDAKVTALRFDRATWPQAYAQSIEISRCPTLVFATGRGPGTYLYERYPVVMTLFGPTEYPQHVERASAYFSYSDEVFYLDEDYWENSTVPTWQPAPPCPLPLDQLGLAETEAAQDEQRKNEQEAAEKASFQSLQQRLRSWLEEQP